MSASVTFRRRGGQYLTRALVLPCLRDHPQAVPSRATLQWDSAANPTYIRHRVTKGIKFQPSGTSRLANGDYTATMTARIHILFLGEGAGQRMLVTTSARIVDSLCADEDGLVGMDLARTVDLRNGVAKIVLAQADKLAQTGGLAQLAGALEERFEVEGCGCWGAFKPLLRGVAAV